jgi:hypothetical protein
MAKKAAASRPLRLGKVTTRLANPPEIMLAEPCMAHSCKIREYDVRNPANTTFTKDPDTASDLSKEEQEKSLETYSKGETSFGCPKDCDCVKVPEVQASPWSKWRRVKSTVKFYAYTLVDEKSYTYTVTGDIEIKFRDFTGQCDCKEIKKV